MLWTSPWVSKAVLFAVLKSPVGSLLPRRMEPAENGTMSTSPVVTNVAEGAKPVPSRISSALSTTVPAPRAAVLVMISPWLNDIWRWGLGVCSVTVPPLAVIFATA